MGKLHYISEKDGYDFISDKGYTYDLLEGISLGGISTSDIVFVILSYENGEDLYEKIEDKFVYFFYGAEFVLRDREQTVELLDKVTKDYEDKNNL